MNYCRYCQWAEWSLAAIVVGLNVAVFLWRENPSRPNFLLSSAHDAQLLSAIVLIVGWIVLGPGRLWIRLAASPFLVGLWLLPWNRAMQPRDMPADFLVMLVGASILLVGVLRVAGLRVSRSTDGASDARGSQFSILGLILATTVIGIVIGALEAARPMLQAGGASEFGWASPRAIQTRGIVMAVAVVFSCMSGLFVVLRPGSIWIRLTAIVALLPAFALYLGHLSGASNTYVGLTTTTMLVPTAVNLSYALGMTAVFSALCVLPQRFAGFRMRRRPQLIVDIVARREENFAMTKRVAAIVSLCIALGLLSLGDRLVADSTTTDSGRININSAELARLFAPSPDDQTPINAMAQWINPNVWWMKFILCSSSSKPVFSQADWFTFPLNDVQGWVGLSAGRVPAVEKTDEQTQ